MNITIPVMISTAFIILSFLALFMLPSFKSRRPKLIKASGIFLGAAIVVFVLLGIFLNTAVDCQSRPSAVSFVITSLAAYFGFVVSQFVSRKRLKKYAVRVAVIALVSFIAETFLFNFKSISRNNEEYQADYSKARTETPEAVQLTDQEVQFSADGSVIFNVSSDNIHAVRLGFEGKDKRILCSVNITDKNFSRKFINVGEKYVTSDKGNGEFTLIPYGELNEIKIELSEVDEPLSITSCILSTVLPFRFSNTRFFAVFLFLAAVCAVVTFELYKKVYNSSSWKHKLCTGIVAVLCAAGVFVLYQPDQKLIDYKKADIANSDPYIQMFDAVQNGRLNIDIEPAPELLEAENPYDISIRDESDIPYSWDRALYNGKYYSYYGIIPVFLFYYPLYMITGKLPTLNISNVFFAFVSILFLCGAILAFVKRFIKKPNFLLLILTMTAACFSSGGYFLAASSSQYSLPGVCGSCFLYLCLWTGFSACRLKKKIPKYILFAVSGISFALCFASRPTRAVSALILAPVFLGIIFSKKLKIRQKLCSALSFLIPVIAGAAAIMAYNNARFDSPFEFGAKYQLTVSDVSANKVTLSQLPYAIMHYFFQPFEATKKFPFFELSIKDYSGYGKYIYTDTSHGAFVYPLIFAGAVILPFFLYHYRRKKGTKFIYNNSCIKKYTYVLMAVIPILLAWLDFCVAGVILSYVCDILPLLALLSVWVILDTHKGLSASQTAAGKSACAFSIICIATVMVALMELVALYSSGKDLAHEKLFYAIEELICFWN